MGDWRGSWTRCSPSDEVNETFASSRLFRADPAKTEIVQVNHYRYADGRSIKKEWKYNIEDHSHKDGLCGLANAQSSAHPDAPFELFLKLVNIQHSVGVLYGKTRNLLRTAGIRDRPGRQSDISWTDTVDQVEPWTLDNRWKGEKLQINPEFSCNPSRGSDWQWMDMDQSNHFFPDGIILRCPERNIPEQDFSIQVV